MTRLETFFAMLLAVLLGAPLCAQAQDPHSRTAPALAHLAELAASSPDLDVLERSLHAEGARYTRSPRSIRIELAYPIETRAAARTLGLRRPCVVSGDVHQVNWALYECVPYAPGRLDAHDPRAGAWAFVPQVDRRPSGPLPGVSAGASPAYDAATTTSRVIAVVVMFRMRHA